MVHFDTQLSTVLSTHSEKVGLHNLLVKTSPQDEGPEIAEDDLKPEARAHEFGKLLLEVCQVRS